MDQRPDPRDGRRVEDPRSELARARGLDAPSIPGGEDPDPEDGLREERFFGRLLLLMVVAIVGSAFVLTVLAIAFGAFGYGGH
ncbi:MAG TPA: hypothetical protein VGK63_12460 [Candidatus Limnocylindrales bacterium]